MFSKKPPVKLDPLQEAQALVSQLNQLLPFLPNGVVPWVEWKPRIQIHLVTREYSVKPIL